MDLSFLDKVPESKPKYSSPEEIRIALGLKPWDEFAIESIEWWLADKHTDKSQKLQYIYSKRRTGQTTKMLVEAVYVSQSKVVGISGRKESWTYDLVKQAKSMCQQLGLDDSNIKPWVGKMKAVGVHYVETFVDHYAGSKQ